MHPQTGVLHLGCIIRRTRCRWMLVTRTGLQKHDTYLRVQEAGSTTCKTRVNRGAFVPTCNTAHSESKVLQSLDSWAVLALPVTARTPPRLPTASPSAPQTPSVPRQRPSHGSADHHHHKTLLDGDASPDRSGEVMGVRVPGWGWEDEQHVAAAVGEKAGSKSSNGSTHGHSHGGHHGGHHIQNPLATSKRHSGSKSRDVDLSSSHAASASPTTTSTDGAGDLGADALDSAEGPPDAGPWPAAFHAAFYAQVWCTYRAGFEPIRDLPSLSSLPPPLFFPNAAPYLFSLRVFGFLSLFLYRIRSSLSFISFVFPSTSPPRCIFPPHSTILFSALPFARLRL
ncbi:hypothetical protein K438DRAFT_1874105, partial [Mycena galopus ATCC 62051]